MSKNLELTLILSKRQVERTISKITGEESVLSDKGWNLLTEKSNSISYKDICDQTDAVDGDADTILGVLICAIMEKAKKNHPEIFEKNRAFAINPEDGKIVELPEEMVKEIDELLKDK